MRADAAVLLGCVFLMGLHSTLFGPVKFAYLPQVLDARELTGGNGMVEMGTFVAILLGQVAGGLLVALPADRPHDGGGGLRAAGAGGARAWRRRFRPRRPPIRAWRSTGTRSPRPGAT